MTVAASSFLASVAFLGVASSPLVASWLLPVAAIAVVVTAIACAIAMEEQDSAAAQR